MRRSFVRVSRLGVGILVAGMLAGLFGHPGTTWAADTVIFVVQGGSGIQDGQSWASAKDLQAAFTGATSGQQLWVKGGTYTPTTGTFRHVSFWLKTGVAVYGGFAGDETQLSQRNIAANVTTLSGEIGAAGSADNSHHVVFSQGVDSTAVLDGFTISGGNAFGDPGNNTGGAGILNSGGSPQLTNLIITGNAAGSDGGGLYNNGGSPMLTNITISGNTAGSNGGGMGNYDSAPVLRNVTISGNFAASGGGLYNYKGSPVLTNVTISGNTAGADGGGVHNFQSSPQLTNVTISGNRAGADGGGMSNSEYCNPVLTNVTISGNTAGRYGGGVSNWISNPTLRDSTISGNRATNHGGGLYNNISSPVLTNIIISGNSASYGGGLHNLNSSPALRNVTVAGNMAGSRGAGGGMYNHNSGGTLVRNSIVWGNINGTIVNNGPRADVQNSLIEGDYYMGTGILDVDPRFVTAVPAAPSTGGDMRLQVVSPAINAGDNNSIPAGVTTDRDGNPRVIDITVDLGAYEDQQACGSFTRLFVTPGGQGSATGVSWANAMGDLQVALARARVCVAVTQVWVAQGIYTPTGGPEREATFTLMSGLAIYGGFAGGETLLSERNVAANVTHLSGEIAAPGSSDNSYHVVTGGGTNATAHLDGVTISGGNASGSSPHDSGGGVYNNGGSPTLTNVTISGNAVTSIGGGMYNNASSNPTLTNVTLSGNSASVGGGLYNRDGSNPTLANVTVSGNSASIGGGLFNNASSPLVHNSILWGNASSQILDVNGSSSTVRTSIVQGGYASGTGILTVDPRFVTAVPAAPSTGGNLRLQAGSPAINAGDNSLLPSGILTDRDDLPRIVALRIDMGAYERQAAQAITFAPVGAKTYGDPPFDVSATATSGLPVTFTASGVCTVGGSTVTLTSAGTCTLTANQAGDATYDPAQAVLTIEVARRATATTLTSSATPSTLGQEVTFTAKVTAASGGTTSGTVTFQDGATVLGTGTLSSGVATFTTASLSAGRHTIYAVYGGSATHLASQRSLSQSVWQVSTTILTSSLNPSRYGQAVTFTAQVSGDGGTPTGTVTFLDGATVLRSFTLADGSAVLRLTTLSVGTHSITVRYNGSAVYARSTSPTLSQGVQKAITTTTLSSSANPSAVGQAVTFTARVVAASGGVPTGSVTFKDGTSILGTGTLSSGVATFTTASLSAGTHAITANYGASPTHLASSRGLSQVVQ